MIAKGCSLRNPREVARNGRNKSGTISLSATFQTRAHCDTMQC